MQTKPQINKNPDDFINKSKDSFISSPVKKQNDELFKKTYYLSQDHINWISNMAFYENMDKSEIVRKALENFIPDKYKIKR